MFAHAMAKQVVCLAATYISAVFDQTKTHEMTKSSLFDKFAARIAGNSFQSEASSPAFLKSNHYF